MAMALFLLLRCLNMFVQNHNIRHERKPSEGARRMPQDVAVPYSSIYSANINSKKGQNGTSHGQFRKS